MTAWNGDARALMQAVGLANAGDPAALLAVAVAAASLATALFGLVALWRRRHRRPSPQRELIEQEERHGDELLRMAREIERHAVELELAGVPARHHRRWVRACHSLAAEHLVRINALLLEELRAAGTGADAGSGIGPARDAGRRRPASRR